MPTPENTANSPAREYATRFDLVAHSIKDQVSVTEALENGYEPFAVSNAMVKRQDSKLALNQTAKPEFEMDTVLWFKRGTSLPLMTQQEMDEAKLTKMALDQEMAENNAKGNV